MKLITYIHKIIIIIFLLAAINNYGQQNWKWINPSPQGNSINDISVIDGDNAIGVGDNGLFIKSTDAGLSWSVLTSGYPNTLLTSFFIDKLNGWAAGENGIILRTIDGGLTFTRQDTGGVTYNINSIFFTSINIGYAVSSNGVLLKTTNGGILWSSTLINAQFSFSKIYFFDPNTGWLTGSQGIIKKTTDGGATWSDENSGVNSILSSISFTDQNYGWICGQNGQILKTTDGGSNWSVIKTATYKWILSISFIDHNTGFAAGKNGVILRTNDGGTNWDIEEQDTTFTFNSVKFLTTGTGWLAGSSGFLARSTDAGTNWEFQSSGNRANLNSIYFASPLYGFIVGDQGTFLITSDGGTTWQKKDLNTTAALNDVIFFSNYSSSMLWVAGDGARLFFSIDLGITWALQNIKDVPSVNYKRIVRNGYSLFAAGNGGIVVEMGMTKPFVRNSICRFDGDNLRDICFPNAQHLIAPGENGKVLTAWMRGGQGASFQFSEMSIPDVSNINRVCFVGNYLWMTGLYGVLLKSTNMGGAWNKSLVDITEGNDVQFLDTLNGYLCGSNGTFLKSTDGGTSWNKLLTHTTNSLSKMLFTDAKTGWIIGANGLIMKTETGGGASVSGINDASNNSPASFSLSQNFPNPFNPETNINYSISERSKVSIKIFNILGKEISTLVNENKDPGNYNIKINMDDQPSGIYFYRIQAGDFSQTRKMILLK